MEADAQDAQGALPGVSIRFVGNMVSDVPLNPHCRDPNLLKDGPMYLTRRGMKLLRRRDLLSPNPLTYNARLTEIKGKEFVHASIRRSGLTHGQLISTDNAG